MSVHFKIRMSSISGRKSDSGAARRKRKKPEASFVASIQGSLLRHLKSVTKVTFDDTVAVENVSIDHAQLLHVSVRFALLE